MRKERKKEERRTLLEYLAINGDVGSDALSGDVYMELRGRNCLIVKGCKRILGYSPDSVLLEVKKDILSIKGKRLVCTSYFSGGVSIEGIVRSVSFEGEDEE